MSDPQKQAPEKRSFIHQMLNRLLYAAIAAVIFGGLVYFIDGRFNAFAIGAFFLIFLLANAVTDFLGKRF